MSKISDDPSINVYVVEAILLAFQVWVPKWEKQTLRIFMDSNIAFLGLREFIFKELANALLWEIWFLAAKWEIIIESHQIKSKKTG